MKAQGGGIRNKSTAVGKNGAPVLHFLTATARKIAKKVYLSDNRHFFAEFLQKLCKNSKLTIDKFGFM